MPTHNRTFLPTLTTLIAAALLILAPFAQAEGLRYRVEGLDREARDNVTAYLGESPEDEAAAERFLVTAPQRVSRALEALLAMTSKPMKAT